MRYSIFITGVVLAIALSQARAEPPGTGRAAPCQAAQLSAVMTAAAGERGLGSNGTVNAFKRSI